MNDAATCIFQTSLLHDSNNHSTCYLFPGAVAHEPPIPYGKTTFPDVIAEVPYEDVLQESPAPSTADLQHFPAPLTAFLQPPPAPLSKGHGHLEAQLKADLQ